ARCARRSREASPCSSAKVRSRSPPISSRWWTSPGSSRSRSAARRAGITDRSVTGRWLASILLPPAVLAASAWLAPHVPAGSLTAILAGVFAFACVGAEVIVAGTWAPPLSHRSSLGLLVPAALLVAIALLGAAIPAVLAAVLVTACLLGAGSRLGATVGHAI